MEQVEAEARLRAAGFQRVHTWYDSPNFEYQPHSHPGLTAHIVISGEMISAFSGQQFKVQPGQRMDVPAQTLHTAVKGPEGCTYVVGV